MSELIKKTGLSAKEVCLKLRSQGIDFRILEHNRDHPRGPYFIDTAINVPRISKLLDKLFGEAKITHSSKPGRTYLASYMVLGSYRNFKGIITFNDEGEVIERTRLYFK